MKSVDVQAPHDGTTPVTFASTSVPGLHRFDRPNCGRTTLIGCTRRCSTSVEGEQQPPLCTTYTLVGLNSAVKRHMLSWNPAPHVELLEHERPSTQVWSPAQAAEFLAAADEDRLGSLFHLMLFTGIRRGEALGLHWAQVDTARRHIVVHWQVTDAGSGPQLGRP